ncbi:MAG: hypothetical protein NTZ67_09050 [Gammaproteobacteria bacterium]|nr:hypothetical protein [Gammaproteobacteria bacterium]
MTNLNLRFKPTFAFFLGAGLGFALCINNIDIFILVFFLPIIWLGFANRWTAALFIASFYLSASWEIIPDLFNYLKWDWVMLANAIAIWLIAAVIITTPWLICFTKKRTIKSILFSLFFLSFLLTIPPFGVLCWVVPLTSTGLIYPGLSWLGCLFYFFLTFSMAILIYIPAHRKKTFPIVIVLLGVSIFSHIHSYLYFAKIAPQQWVSVNTNSHFTVFDRYIFQLLQKQIQLGKKVIILPENTISLDKLYDQPSWQSLIHFMNINHISLISGAFHISPQSITLLQGFKNKHREGVVIIENNKISFHDSRQPLPLMSWLPFGLGNVSAFWWQTGVYSVQGKKVGIFMCYEDFSPWMMLTTMQGKPDILISLANHWWDKPTAIQKQILIFKIWGKLLNKPVLTAENI